MQMSTALILMLLGCASTTCAQIPNLGPYLPQLQQLVLSTENGMFCTGALVSAPGSQAGRNNGYAIQCNLAKKPDAVSFNTPIKVGSSSDPMRTITTTFGMLIRPGSGLASNLFSDGLVLSAIVSRGSPSLPYSQPAFAWETTAGVSGLTVPFEATGSGLMYLTVPPVLVGGATKYCRVGNYTTTVGTGVSAVKGAVMANMLVCDATSHANATRFRIQPAGWSWLNTRVQFTNVFTNQSCGNRFFTANASYVTCDGGVEPGVEDWKDIYYSNVLRVPQLPMRSDAEFMIQAWLEYPLPTSLWVTGSDHYIQVGQFEQDPVTGVTTVPPGDTPFISMLKNDGPSKFTTISNGNRVLLRSSVTNKFCRVDGEFSRLLCTASLHQVQAAPDRSLYQFIYGEFVPY